MEPDESRPETLPVWIQLLWTNNRPPGFFGTQRIETIIDKILSKENIEPEPVGNTNKLDALTVYLTTLAALAGNLFLVLSSIESRHRHEYPNEQPLYPMPALSQTTLVVKNVYEIAEWRSPVAIKCIQNIITHKDSSNFYTKMSSTDFQKVAESVFDVMYAATNGFKHPVTTTSVHNQNHLQYSLRNYFSPPIAVKHYTTVADFNDEDMKCALVVDDSLIVPSTPPFAKCIRNTDLQQYYLTGEYKTVWFHITLVSSQQETFVLGHPEYSKLATKRYTIWNTMPASKFDVLENMGEKRRNSWIAAIENAVPFKSYTLDPHSIHTIISKLINLHTTPENGPPQHQDAYVMRHSAWYDAALVIAAIKQGFDTDFDAVHFDTEEQYKFATNLIECQKKPYEKI